MQHGHELCNHLQERKLKCKNSALGVTVDNKHLIVAACWFSLSLYNIKLYLEKRLENTELK